MSDYLLTSKSRLNNFIYPEMGNGKFSIENMIEVTKIEALIAIAEELRIKNSK